MGSHVTAASALLLHHYKKTIKEIPFQFEVAVS